MAKLFLLRHLKSQWNKDERFSGWADNPLSHEGREQAAEISRLFNVESVDKVYTSPLARNMETVLRVFEHSERYPFFTHIDGGKMQRWGNHQGSGHCATVYVSEKLNERYYGKIQGMSHDDAIMRYGVEKVQAWRRGWNIRPPEGESLKDVYKRVVPFFKRHIETDLKTQHNVLIVASHNSLRALIKYIENISDSEIAKRELPFGNLLAYTCDIRGKFIIAV
jgi:2,3-bisphosphoglycerate-dependent phosphoglycerate mutase